MSRIESKCFLKNQTNKKVKCFVRNSGTCISSPVGFVLPDRSVEDPGAVGARGRRTLLYVCGLSPSTPAAAERTKTPRGEGRDGTR